jgi:hypothetical protein
VLQETKEGRRERTGAREHLPRSSPTFSSLRNSRANASRLLDEVFLDSCFSEQPGVVWDNGRGLSVWCDPVKAGNGTARNASATKRAEEWQRARRRLKEGLSDRSTAGRYDGNCLAD